MSLVHTTVNRPEHIKDRQLIGNIEKRFQGNIIVQLCGLPILDILSVYHCKEPHSVNQLLDHPFLSLMLYNIYLRYTFIDLEHVQFSRISDI